MHCFVIALTEAQSKQLKAYAEKHGLELQDAAEQIIIERLQLDAKVVPIKPSD